MLMHQCLILCLFLLPQRFCKAENSSVCCCLISKHELCEESAEYGSAWLSQIDRVPMCSWELPPASESPQAGLEKSGVLGEMYCGLESLKQWFLPCSKEKEVDLWTLPTECPSRLKAKSSSAIPARASQGNMGRQTKPVNCNWEPLSLLRMSWVGLCKTIEQNYTPFPKILYYICCSTCLSERRAKHWQLCSHARAEAWGTVVIQRPNWFSHLYL